MTGSSNIGRVPDSKNITPDVDQAGSSTSHLVVERNSPFTLTRSSSMHHIDFRDHLVSPPLIPSVPSNIELERRLAALAASRSESLLRLPEISPLKHDWESSSNEGEPTRVAREEILSSISSSTGESFAGPCRLAAPDAVLMRDNAAITSTTNLIQPHSVETPPIGTPKLIKDLGRDYSRYPRYSSNSRSDSSLPTLQPPPSVGTIVPVPALPHTAPNTPLGKIQADIEKWSYPDDGIGAFDPYFGGEKGFILYNDEKEEDDKYHMPADDDDKRYRPKLADYFHAKTIASAIGGIFLVLGMVCLFILFPILTYARKINMPTQRGSSGDHDGIGPAWAHVNNNTYPLIKNVRRGLIDADTPKSAYTRQSTFDKTNLKLVFSDEFNKPNRTFYSGDDPYWTAPDIWYGATQDMEWYDPDAATTGGGTLQLRLDRFPNHNLEFRSGMLNSWNQMCFKGGIFEVSVSLAGPSGIPGLWPGAWSMGNLGRPGYKATTEGVWPYTYDSCDIGITPNQSSPDGMSRLPGQKLSSCTCPGEDHPSPGTGRGAPEIDILEGSVDPNNLIGVVTQSFQVAPFDIWYRPNSDFLQIPNYNTTQMNGYCGGPFQQAVSGTTLLNNNWYDGKEFQKYAFEYVPGTDKGKIAWFVGEDQTFMMDGRAIGPNGNVDARVVSEEPMSLVLNLGISASWSEIRMPLLKFPTIMHIDYVRIYQKEGQEMVTCDPPGYPTTEYIKNHPKAYRNINLTEWDQTGYGWPKNSLMHGC